MIEADEPRTISPFDGMSLVDLIVKTGIAEAIATQLGALSGNRDAIAETIENNVRSRILKEHLSDPAFYAKMSALLDEIIAARRAKALEYEEYLKRIAGLVQEVAAGHVEETPEPLKRSPALRALYHNLKEGGRKPAQPDEVAQVPAEYDSTGDRVLDLALRLDAAVKRVRPDGWRGVQAREMVIKDALYQVLEDVDEVERTAPAYPFLFGESDPSSDSGGDSGSDSPTGCLLGLVKKLFGGGDSDATEAAAPRDLGGDPHRRRRAEPPVLAHDRRLQPGLQPVDPEEDRRARRGRGQRPVR